MPAVCCSRRRRLALRRPAPPSSRPRVPAARPRSSVARCGGRGLRAFGSAAHVRRFFSSSPPQPAARARRPTASRVNRVPATLQVVTDSRRRRPPATSPRASRAARIAVGRASRGSRARRCPRARPAPRDAPPGRPASPPSAAGCAPPPPGARRARAASVPAAWASASLSDSSSPSESSLGGPPATPAEPSRGAATRSRPAR